MRLFAAVTLSEEMKEDVLRLMEALRNAGVEGHYTLESNLHLTLAFIGEYPDPLKVLRAVNTVAFQPFQITPDGLGAFGDILWAGVRDGGRLADLANDLRRALKEAGIPYADRDFVPHITLVRKAVWPGEIPTIPMKRSVTDVESITLMQSTPGKDGMIYTPVEALDAGESIT